LFLWLNELSELNELLKAQNFQFNKVLRIISTLCGLVFYIADNILFLANLDFVSPYVPGTKNLKWKQIKNIFSLIRTVLEIFIQFY
jgi:hypothetical protein